jgi:hypothetical protein
MDAGGHVEMKVQLPKEEWERTLLNTGEHGTLRIVYDPYDDTNWLLPEVAIGQPVDRLFAATIALFIGVTMVLMGTTMVIDAFHCGPHVWGFPSCCDDCHDWVDVSSGEGSLEQVCWRGGCDGVGGKSHPYWCGNGYNEKKCYIGWSLVPPAAATVGLCLAVIATLQKNLGVCKAGGRMDSCGGFVCGEGKFCCPDQPPRLYLNGEVKDGAYGERQMLLDFANSSGHL